MFGSEADRRVCGDILTQSLTFGKFVAGRDVILKIITTPVSVSIAQNMAQTAGYCCQRVVAVSSRKIAIVSSAAHAADAIQTLGQLGLLFVPSLVSRALVRASRHERKKAALGGGGLL